MSEVFGSAFLLALAFCAAPGAVGVEALRRGLHGGFRPVLLLQLGSLIGDAAWAALALAGAALVITTPLRSVLGLLGAAFLFWLAWQAWRGARPAQQAQRWSDRGHFAAGATISLANPFALAFWLAVSGGIAVTAAARPTPSHLASFFAGFMAGALVWAISFSALVAAGRRFVRQRVLRAIELASALALAFFAVRLLWNTFNLLLV